MEFHFNYWKILFAWIGKNTKQTNKHFLILYNSKGCILLTLVGLINAIHIKLLRLGTVFIIHDVVPNLLN